MICSLFCFAFVPECTVLRYGGKKPCYIFGIIWYEFSVGYHGKVLIHGIEIGVQRGEIVTLVGPNGSGKSTILKTITRQLSPVSGDIYLAQEKTAGQDGTVPGMKKLGQFEPGELAREMAVMLTGRLQTELMR